VPRDAGEGAQMLEPFRGAAIVPPKHSQRI
jgi:hypothetical protein